MDRRKWFIHRDAVTKQCSTYFAYRRYFTSQLVAWVKQRALGDSFIEWNCNIDIIITLSHYEKFNKVRNKNNKNKKHWRLENNFIAVAISPSNIRLPLSSVVCRRQVPMRHWVWYCVVFYERDSMVRLKTRLAEQQWLIIPVLSDLINIFFSWQQLHFS